MTIEAPATAIQPKKKTEMSREIMVSPVQQFHEDSQDRHVQHADLPA